jgi:glyceraldehyde-3-phosphate dehydrogenase (NADP+)
VETGKRILRDSIGAEFVFELGGKDGAIVLSDLRPNQFLETAQKIIKGAFTYSGQRCTAVKLLFLPKVFSKEFIKILKSLVNKLEVGTNLKQENIIGPLISQESADNNYKLLQEAIAQGAKSVNNIQVNKNLFFPVLLTEVNPNMKIFTQEQFAPILPIITYENVFEVVDLINELPYGLQSSIFGNDIKIMMNIAEKISVGTVNLNEVSQRSPDYFPFLANKDSGIGAQGSKHLLFSFTKLKGLIINY